MKKTISCHLHFVRTGDFKMMVMNGRTVNYKRKPAPPKLAKKCNEENMKNEDGIQKVQGRGKKA